MQNRFFSKWQLFCKVISIYFRSRQIVGLEVSDVSTRRLCEQTMILGRKVKRRVVLITCLASTLLAIGMFVTHVVPKGGTLRSLLPQISQINGSQTKAAAKEAVDTLLNLFVRMSGKSSHHRQRYYCDLFRTTVLYWSPSYGKVVMVLDKETKADRKFGEEIIDQTKRYFPDRKLEVFYETLLCTSKLSSLVWSVGQDLTRRPFLCASLSIIHLFAAFFTRKSNNGLKAAVQFKPV